MLCSSILGRVGVVDYLIHLGASDRFLRIHYELQRK